MLVYFAIILTVMLGFYHFNTPIYAPNHLNIVATNMYDYFGNIKPAVNNANLPVATRCKLPSPR